MRPPQFAIIVNGNNRYKVTETTEDERYVQTFVVDPLKPIRPRPPEDEEEQDDE